MTTYISEVATQKKYVGNVVIRFNGQYFAIRNPDSGLVIGAPFDKCLQSLVLNPTSIDLRRVTTTIASYSFKLIDKDEVITAIVQGNAAALVEATVEIWLGRSNVAMDFADYFKLPDTKISKLDHADNAYSFSATEETERMARPIYDAKSALAVDILAATTTLTMRDSLADFPATGFIKIDSEFMSYSGINFGLNQFTGVIRGELGSTPVAHTANTTAFQTETVTDNPVSILLKILTSNGGGGAYDVLQDGLGISASLIDIAAIEAIRDTLFLGQQFTLSLYNIDPALKFLEEQILMPCNLRFTYSRTSKITLAILDKAIFVEETDFIDEDTITKYPKWSVDGSKVANSIEVQWDFFEPTNTYRQRTVAEDAASIALYGKKTALKYSFKGIKASLDGQTLVDDFTTHLLDRLSTPTPEIQISTHIDKSLQTIGDKSLIESSQIPNQDGTLNFASELEIVSRAINITNGDVQFKLAFTSFTNIRSCFIAPSDSIQTVISQKKVTIPAGRGALYSPGWKIRLWRIVDQTYMPDAINTIDTVVGDTITFLNDFTTILTGPNNYKLKFADYDDVAESQKRYCFVSDNGANFVDGKPTYKVTY